MAEKHSEALELVQMLVRTHPQDRITALKARLSSAPPAHALVQDCVTTHNLVTSTDKQAAGRQTDRKTERQTDRHRQTHTRAHVRTTALALLVPARASCHKRTLILCRRLHVVVQQALEHRLITTAPQPEELLPILSAESGALFISVLPRSGIRLHCGVFAAKTGRVQHPAHPQQA
jgi:hypothetical protein